jgi:hypothetical protein
MVRAVIVDAWLGSIPASSDTVESKERQMKLTMVHKKIKEIRLKLKYSR